MTKNATFYLVTSDLSQAPINDHLMHGYESRHDFYRALRKLVNRWHGRIGECIGERHGFLLLRFHDTPGGRPDEEWLPEYLLQTTERPEYMEKCETDTSDELTKELDQAFGFD